MGCHYSMCIHMHTHECHSKKKKANLIFLMSVKCTVCRSRSEKYHECIHCGNRYDDVEKLAAHQLERGHPGGHAPARGPLARVERRSYLEMLNDKSDDAAADTETYELHDDDDVVVNTNDSVEDAVPQGRSTSRGRRGGKRGVADAKSKRARSSTVAETPPPPPMLSPPSSTSTTPTVSTTAKLSTTPAKSPRELKIERFEQMLPDDIAVKYDDDAPVTFRARAGAAIRTARCCSAKERRLISPPTSTLQRSCRRAQCSIVA
jgi:hypothetical protein